MARQCELRPIICRLLTEISILGDLCCRYQVHHTTLSSSRHTPLLPNSACPSRCCSVCKITPLLSNPAHSSVDQVILLLPHVSTKCHWLMLPAHHCLPKSVQKSKNPAREVQMGHWGCKATVLRRFCGGSMHCPEEGCTWSVSFKASGKARKDGRTGPVLRNWC